MAEFGRSVAEQEVVAAKVRKTAAEQGANKCGYVEEECGRKVVGGAKVRKNVAEEGGDAANLRRSGCS